MIRNIPARITSRSPWIARAALSIAVLVAAGGLFAVGSWDGRLDGGPTLLSLEGGRGYSTLVAKGDASTWVYEPTGAQVPFLSTSDMNALDPSERYLFTSHETRSNAGVTRIDLQEDVVEIILADEAFSRFDGLLWTPWGTVLVAEETTGGRLFEILDPLADVVDVVAVERPAFGFRRHEGIILDAHGNLYGIDETSEGGIYRFRPTGH